jgi:hypothetical protein
MGGQKFRESNFNIPRDCMSITIMESLVMSLHYNS